MKFYSGFSLQNESHFFDSFILKSDYCVCGFSYGAIKALRYAKEQLENRQRIDTLQLFSPAFFQTKTQKFLCDTHTPPEKQKSTTPLQG